MKTLTSAEERAAVIARVQTLTPDSRRQWGRMTPHQAVCHLSDSFRGVMGERSISPSSTIFSRTVVKWVALRAPMPWPHGVQTRPEVDQEIGGTKPVEFLKDRHELEALIDEFAQRTSRDLHPHPIFGPMTTDEWLGWGYLHLDHHLRQFGV